MREEFDASQKVKHEAKIIVIIGNRPTTASQAPRKPKKRSWLRITRVSNSSKKPTKTDWSNGTNSGASGRNNAARVCCTKSLAFASNCSTIYFMAGFRDLDIPDARLTETGIDDHSNGWRRIP
jgi:hypothetical protein